MRDIAYTPNLTPAFVPHDAKPAAPANPNAPPQAPQAGAVASGPARPRGDGAEQTKVTGTAVFDDLAGVSQPHVKKRDLKQRLTTVQQRSRNTQRKQLTRINLNQDEDDEPVRTAALETLTALRDGGRGALSEELAGKYDCLQHYALLHNALCEVDEQDAPAAEKQKLKSELNGMMGELMEQHRDEIRQGLKDTQELEAAMQKMAGGSDAKPASLRELRFMYGAKGKGIFDSPLTPLSMSKALFQRFGAGNFSSGLSGLHTRMSAELRAEQTKGMTPRLWLCMSDASAFNSVKSAFKIATELRRDLVAKAGVLPKASPAAMSLSLLTLVEAGKPKANSIVAQIHDTRNADSGTKDRVYTQVLHAVRNLSTTLWPLDKMTQRIELLDELSKQVTSTHKGMPLMETSVERRERAWRADFDKQRDGAAAPAQAAPAA
ncbi:hypothetical protein ACFOLJ_03105 [Rugamonas sp. CCM 8940]|uniref:hypothetical protein n=1 Tax=Rugamonas sp. CCM 8940 TaxID=2765359 RepID=UPI0018F75FCF|nr:hypothetical protein [Rugamonas sp. CCM 8940]MBJ7311928.1 hypothetical protein [Rugamonas sp. CCM 8940]